MTRHGADRRWTSEKLWFPGADGDRLAARLEMPADAAPRAWALFAHCFTCSKDLKAAVRLSRALTAARFAVLRFDFTGLGESEGDFADTNFSSNVADLVAAARFLEREHAPPDLLIGHSLGGAAVLQAAGMIPETRAVATIGAPADPSHVSRHFTGSLEQIEAEGEAEVELAGRRFTVRRQFLEDLEETRMRETIGALGRPLLVLHSPVDRIVGVDNARKIFEAAKHPKSFVSLDTADHLLTDDDDARWTAAVLAAWASRYVAAAPGEEAGRAEVETDREGGVAAAIGASGFRTEIVAGGHALTADEPREVGGTGTGPTPYDLLAASLGACTAMTLRMYADRKGWPLESVRVHLRHRKVHLEDDRNCESEAAKMDELSRTLEVEGPLDAGQRQRLAEIAERCPVHRTLDAGVRIATRLADR